MDIWGSCVCYWKRGLHAQNDEALCWSIENGHLEVVWLLLEKGADVRARNDHALRWSAANGDLEIVRLLLKKGATLEMAKLFAGLLRMGIWK